MSSAATEISPSQNPFRNADVRPDWAQLTRLGGDRVAILFEELRTSISRIDGLIEELHFFGLEEGWLPRYRVDDQIILKVLILPGNLSAILEFDAREFNKLLNSAKVAGRVKAWLGTASIREGIALLRVRLASRTDICSLGNFLIRVSREQV
jgi:hypothetical protein